MGDLTLSMDGAMDEGGLEFFSEPTPHSTAAVGPGEQYNAGAFAAPTNEPYYGGAPVANNDLVSGQMSSGQAVGGGFSGWDDEPPLLEELGINFDHIVKKTMSVLHPLAEVDSQIMADADLAGPLLFCLLFGATLLAAGKVQFGYIYGVALLGCGGMFAVLNLMSDKGISVTGTASILGYSLLPMVGLSAVAIILSLAGIVGTVLSAASVVWCSHSASKFFASALIMGDQKLLIAYPCALLYAVFCLLTVF